MTWDEAVTTMGCGITNTIDSLKGLLPQEQNQYKTLDSSDLYTIFRKVHCF